MNYDGCFNSTFRTLEGGGNNKKELEKFQNLQVGNLKVYLLRDLCIFRRYACYIQRNVEYHCQFSRLASLLKQKNQEKVEHHLKLTLWIDNISSLSKKFEWVTG